MDRITNPEHPLLYVVAWFGYLATLVTPDNVSIAAGMASLCVSLTGIILNLKKINKKP